MHNGQVISILNCAQEHNRLSTVLSNEWAKHVNACTTHVHMHSNMQTHAQQAHTEIERQRATKEKLRKPCVCNSKFCYVYNRKTIFILVSNHIFMQIYMHVFQDTFHTTKLLSEVRDWKALLSSLFTWK